MMSQPMQAPSIVRTLPNEPMALRRKQQCYAIAWALFFIMTGLLWVAPAALIPDGLWLMGAGMLLLGLNAVCALNDVDVNGVAVVVGILMLSMGLGRLMGVDLPLVAILLMATGVVMLLTQRVRHAPGR